MSVLLRYFFIVSLVFFCISCAVMRAPVYIKDGKKCGETKWIFRHRWWNYYERGLSYADCEDWKNANADFVEAIKQREIDQRRARTYGLHIIDYFPHRELGIGLYYQGLYKEAIQELKLSLKTVETAKAQYFLDESRREYLKKTGQDQQPPTIKITYPANKKITSDRKITIKGSVTDDYFVKEIWANRIQFPINVAQSKIKFSLDVPINPDSTTIKVTAIDLLGRETISTVSVVIDRLGPYISINDIREIGGNHIEISGNCRDDKSSVKTFKINNQPASLEQDGSFSVMLPLDEKQEIKLSAVDKAENKTNNIIEVVREGVGYISGKQSNKLVLNAPLQEDPLRYATACNACPASFLSDSSFYTASSSNIVQKIKWILGKATGSDPHKPPKFILREKLNGLKVYSDKIYIEGSVVSTGELRFLMIDDMELKMAGKVFFFNHLKYLHPGKNTITFFYSDIYDNYHKSKIDVFRIVPKARDLGMHLIMSVLSFVEKGEVRNLGPFAFHLLFKVLKDKDRFKLNDPISVADAIRKETYLGTSILTDQDTAVREGKMRKADIVLAGSIDERPKSIEIYAQIIDIEKSKIIIEKDAFYCLNENKKNTNTIDIDSTGIIVEGLVNKLSQDFPLIEGKIIGVQDDVIVVDFNGHSPRQAKKLVIFKKDTNSKETFADLVDTPLVGNAEVGDNDVDDNSKKVRAVIQKGQPAVGDGIITR